MAEYEYGRIKRLADGLAKAGIKRDTMEKIVEGGESVLRATSGRKKADWMREAMARMDALLDRPTRYAIREACACCLGGKRLETSKRIAKAHESLEDRIKAADESGYVGKIAVQDDGRLLVSFAPEGEASYRCVCLTKPEKPVSITYCYCCGGHVKHHLQIALGRKLSCTVRSSALSSG